ncbi:lipase 3-like [Nasonia vitripennis]|uniref:Lipase n=1 Tax=Nasonia vitripennis TaxID=7425 RepID=A0A7M7H9H4_NASVI|nr:lipase 3-like [Nasonia vitripennis]
MIQIYESEFVMRSILFLSVLIGCGCGQSRIGFLDFIRPLSIRREKDPNGKLPVLDFMGLVTRHGYPAEEHQVTTSDSYRLRLHRIPGSPKSPPGPGKPVVLIHHGILCTSDDFVLAGPDRDLGYILADAGYDVWFANVRGNAYSRSHVHLSPDHDPEFWQFSMHEMALYDASRTIDYILGQTGQQSLIIVAHSMGTSISMILLSTRPEYNAKVRLAVFMGSVGFWKRPRNVMQFLKDYGKFLLSLARVLRLREFLPQTLATGELMSGSCRDNSPFQHLCISITEYLSGYDPDLLDTKLLAEAYNYFPAGVSAQTLSHFYQNIKAGRMQMYDYGLMGNVQRYGQTTPPVYSLENIDTPVVLIYGNGDVIASPEDSLDLVTRLRFSRVEMVPHDSFSHFDFMWAKDIKRLLQDRIMQIIETADKYGSYSVL